MASADLPIDILLAIIYHCEPIQLARLELTCQLFHNLIQEYGWPNYLRINPRPSHSLSYSRTTWSTRSTLRHNHHTDRNWSRISFIARPLARPWQGRLQPSMTINDNYLVIGAGSSLYVYAFEAEQKVVGLGKFDLPGPAVGQSAISLALGGVGGPRIQSDEVTSLAFSGRDSELIIGRQYGSLERLDLSKLLTNRPAPLDAPISPLREGTLDIHTGNLIESVSSDTSTSLLLSLSSSGHAVLSNLTSDGPSSLCHEIFLRRRSWTGRLFPSMAAFGTTSSTPLTVHSLLPDHGLSPMPSAILHSKELHSATPSLLKKEDLESSAVYSVTRGPPSSLWGTSDQVVASGWFDGRVRIYDLRTPSASSLLLPTSSTGQDTSQVAIPIHTPVLQASDPWSYDPIYSLSCGGGGNSHIAAGTARHSVISFWDVRKAIQEQTWKTGGTRGRSGWSVHAPGNDSSPVYDVICESSRVWGVSERRAFVYDFGPDVTAATYPELPKGRIDGLKVKHDTPKAGYYVTTYSHKKGMGGW